MKLRNRLPANLQLDSRSRRMFLKSAGGFSLALPLMPSLLTSEKAHADTSAPLRYVNMFSAIGGLQHKNWGGTNLPQTAFQLYSGHTARKDSISSLLQGNALSPVLNSNYANLWSYANVIMGSDQPYYVGHNRGTANGGFAASNPGQAWISDQGDFGKPGFFTNEYPTIDQVLGYANGFGVYGKGLGGRRRNLNLTTSWVSSSWGRDDYLTNDHIQPRDMLNSTSGIFSYLFGSLEPGGLNNPILNLVNEFWPTGRTLIKSLTGDDKDALEKFFSLAQAAADDYSLPGPNISGITAPPGLSSVGPMTPTDLQVTADLIQMAFKADVTRIVNIYVDTVVNGYDLHALSHLPSNANPDAGQAEMVQIYKNQSDNLFARLGNNLLIQDPFDPQSGSILKNSLMQWTFENKCAHELYSLPTLFLGQAGGRIETGTFADLRNLTRPVYTDGTGDAHFVGDTMNRSWASIFYAMNIPRSAYEIARGGNDDTVALTKGYGHWMKLPGPSWYSIPTYDLSKIGEPWEFLTKTGTTWG